MDKVIPFLVLDVCLCAASQCAAQELPAIHVTPTIQLSSEETVTAKHTTEQLKEAQDRATTALANWVSFEKQFAQAHPEVAPWVAFSSDFVDAYEVRDRNSKAPIATVIKLTADEQRKAEGLSNELKASYEAQQRAEKNWENFENAVIVAHVPGVTTKVCGPGTEITVITLPNGGQYIPPAPWCFGIALTPDFRTAVPRSL